MLRNAGIVSVMVLFAAAICYLLIDRGRLQGELKISRQNVLNMQNEARADQEAWEKMYTDCASEKNTLIAKMKELSASAGPHSGTSATTHQ
jgi:hypothetical protein